MLTVNTQIHKPNKGKKSSNGWSSAGKGWFFAPDDFAMSTVFMTDDFTRFSHRSRRRWDLVEYLRDLFSKK